MKTFADFGISVPSGSTGNIRTTCPECSDKRRKKTVKCLAVDVDQGVWICHHCGWAGGLKGRSEHLPIHWQKPEYRKPERKPSADLPANVIAWFASRGITDDVLIRNKVGYGTVYMPQLEGDIGAVAFPYYVNGEHINTKWRDANKNFRMEAGAQRVLYGLDDISDRESVIWVEGEMDKLSVEVAGFRNCVSVPDGAPAINSKEYASKFDFIDWDVMTGKQHVLFVDMDEPGRKLEAELMRRLGEENCARVICPFGCKDANEVLTKHGPFALRDLIKGAQPFPVSGLFDVDRLRDKVVTLYENGYERGVLTGWQSLDHLYTVRPGEMTVLTGIPNSGKSNFLDAMLVNIAKTHGWRFGVFSPENQPLEDHVAHLIEKYVGAPFDQGPSARITPEERDHAIDWLGDHFTWVMPEDDDYSLSGLLQKARVLVRRKGINGFVLDPWNEIDHTRPHGVTETDHVSKCLTEIRRFARAHKVHMWIVAHPTKLQKDNSGNYPVPTPYDISGSAHWRNKADNCLAVYRRFVESGAEPPIEVHVQKIRFREVGRVGTCDLRYEKTTGRYREVYA